MYILVDIHVYVLVRVRDETKYICAHVVSKQWIRPEHVTAS